MYVIGKKEMDRSVIVVWVSWAVCFIVWSASSLGVSAWVVPQSIRSRSSSSLVAYKRNKANSAPIVPLYFPTGLSSSSKDTTEESTSSDTTSISSSKRRLEGCVCLVTGASRGIGKGIALQLGREGATVYVTGTSTSSASKPDDSSSSTSTLFRSQLQSVFRRKAEEPTSDSAEEPYVATSETGGPGTIEQTAKEITQVGGTGIAVYCNHAMDDDVDKLMDRIAREQGGRLDILVNNCFRLPKGGVEVLYGKFWEQGADVWDALHTVGLRSHFVATCKAMPLLLKGRDELAKESNRSSLARPLVAMIGSFGGLTYTFNVAYGVGKAGVDRLAKDMAVELTPEGICVTSFWPGVVATERTKLAVKTGDWEEFVGIPLENAESPEFTGKAIVEVACDESNLETKTGTYQVVAELAKEYDFYDINGKQPPSIRSLQFLLPSYAFDDELRKKIPAGLIPDLRLPFWMMAQGRPPKPDDP